MSLVDDKSIFHDAEFSIIIPRCPDGLEFPAPRDEAAVNAWLQKLHDGPERDCCFYDENLLYLCRLVYRKGQQMDDESRSSFQRICEAIKLTTQCSFIRRRATISGPPAHQSQLGSNSNLGLPPVTPNPMPGMQAGYQQYAQVEGVQVWEGGLSGNPTDTDPAVKTQCLVVREEGGLAAYWIGRVPLAFANVEMQDPLFALTCHATLRETVISSVGPRAGFVEPSGQETEHPEDQTVTVEGIIGMRDVLAGLGGASLPSSRLRKPDEQISKDPSTRSTPSSLARSEPAMVLRKSYRSVLPLYSAITVKMRTLPRPLVQATDTDDSDSLTSTICIEIESGHGQSGLGFQVTNVRVSTRQTEGSHMSTEVIHLLANHDEGTTYFPFRLERFAQHNLVYNIKADASTSATSQINNQYLSANGKVEHLRIDIDGFAYSPHEGKLTPQFTSTWNTILELKNADLQARVAYLNPINDSSNQPFSTPVSARSRQSSQFAAPKKASKVLHRDLVVSLNLIEAGDRGASAVSSDSTTLNKVFLFDTIDAEVTILNVSGRTVRLVLSEIDGNQTISDPTTSLASTQRRRKAKRAGSTVERDQNPIIMLQNDLKLTPLMPRSCQSVRLRYMAMMQGSQQLPGLRLTDFERDQQVELDFEIFLEVT